MPETSSEIFRQMNSEKSLIPDQFGLMIKLNHQIATPVPLFRKLEDQEINKYREMFAGGQKTKNETKEEKLEIFVTGKDENKIPEIEKKLKEQADHVRKIKTEKKEKNEIDAAVKGIGHTTCLTLD